MVGKLGVFIVLAMLFQVPKPKVILFFGDSLTAGYGLNPEDAFPAVVGMQLTKSGAEVRVINAGLSGETSAGGLSRIDWILQQPSMYLCSSWAPTMDSAGSPSKRPEKTWRPS